MAPELLIEDATTTTPARLWSRPAIACLMVVMATCAAVLSWYALLDYPGYDSEWHVFIASQSTWADFWREVAANEHPPLFYLALMGAMRVFGTSLLAYRVVSIGATVASTCLVARIVARQTADVWIGVLAAAAFGLSFTAIEIGLEIRAYALADAFMLLAFGAYLRWLEAPADTPTSQRLLFTTTACAAALTHYSTLFFLAAVVATPLVLALGSRSWGIRLADDIRRHPVAVVLMILIPVVVGAVAYIVHARGLSFPLNHVATYLYGTEGESAPAFLSRTTGSFLSLLVPPWGLDAAIVVVVGILSAALCLAAWWSERASTAAVPFIFTAVMVALNVTAALARRYPFGGELRHEYFMFPFLVICLFAAVGWARRHVAVPWMPRAVPLLATAVVVCASILAAFTAYGRTSVDRAPLFPPHVAKFESVIHQPSAVLVDQFGLIIFFANHDHANWRRSFVDVQRSMWEVFDLQTAGSDMKVCRSRQWSLDLSAPDTYQDIADCVSRTGVTTIAIFRPQQPGFEPAWLNSDMRPVAEKFGRAHGVIPAALSVDALGAYGAFERQPAP